MNHELRIMGKTVLVTGAAKGLGAAIALGFADAGATVALHYRSSREEAEKTLEEVQALSPKSFLVSGDLSVEEDVESIMEEIEEKTDGVDILINSIGPFIFKPIDETTFAEFRDVIEGNLYSSFLCSQAVLPGMRKKGKGHIINFGCVAADRLTIRKNTTPYYMAKSSVLMLTKVMAAEEAEHGIRINAISPGILETSVVKYENLPQSRFAQFDDIVNAITYLVSPEADYVNGANLEVSGAWIPGYEH